MKFTYLSMILVWEILIAEFLFLHPFKRRKHFVLRLVLVVVICSFCGLIFPSGIFQDNFAKALLNFSRYFGLFALTVAGQLFLFEGKFRDILAACAAGYATQHFSSRFTSILRLFLPGFNIENKFLSQFVNMLAYYSVPYVAIFFVFGKKARAKLRSGYSSFNMDFLSISMIVICMLVTRIADFGSFSTVARISVNVYGMICCILSLVLQYTMYDLASKDRELEMTQKLYESKKEEYKRWQDSIDVINIKCHDLKHMIGSLRANYSESSIKEIENAAMIYDSVLKTGNDVLDMIFFEKNVYAEKHGIELLYMIDGEALNHIGKEDLFTFFGNLIENAFEAVERLDVKEKQVVHITVNRVAGMVFIHEENYFDGTVETNDEGLPITTKSDRDLHGFGVKSMKVVINKYGGTLNFSTENDVFTLNAWLPLQSEAH